MLSKLVKFFVCSSLLFSLAKAQEALVLSPMPLVRQSYNDCGPASIGMVMGYYKLPFDVAEISSNTKASPHAYMHVEQIGRYVGQFGLQTARVKNSNINSAIRVLRLGVPIIALTYFKDYGQIPHFRVLRGFDNQKQIFYIADPLAGSVAITYHDFDILWNTQGRQMVAVYPPHLKNDVIAAIKNK